MINPEKTSVKTREYIDKCFSVCYNTDKGIGEEIKATPLFIGYYALTVFDNFNIAKWTPFKRCVIAKATINFNIIRKENCDTIIFD